MVADEPTADISASPRYRALKRLARLLDSSIPLPGGLRIGVDGLIGLIPGIGDLVGAALALYIVFGAHRLGASRSVVVHMLGNVAVETLVGCVPIVGDLFDFAWKANQRNLALLEGEFARPTETRRRSRWLVFSVAAGAVALLGLAGLGLAVLARVAWQAFTT